MIAAANGACHADESRRPSPPLFPPRRDLARQHQALLRLDDRLLSDIGLTRAEALRGADEARWDAPAHWFGDD